MGLEDGIRYFTLGEIHAILAVSERIWSYREKDEDIDSEEYLDALGEVQERWPELFEGEVYDEDAAIHVGDVAPCDHCYIMPSGGVLHETVVEGDDGNRGVFTIYRTDLTKARFMSAYLTIMGRGEPSEQVDRAELLMGGQDTL